MTEQTFSLERIDTENARIMSGVTIVGNLSWTDSFWVLMDGTKARRVHVWTDLTEVDDMDSAFLLSISEGYLSAQSTDLDFMLDPPTFVGPTEGERACWAYVVWKQITSGAPHQMEEWGPREYAGAATIYRRVRRKYGDSPPDKTGELKGLTTDA